MRRSSVWYSILAMPAVVLVLALTGCVDETIVYRDRELVEDLPTGAASFLGYSDAEDKLTVCGNCHIGHQVKWQQTAHADAWATLAASGSSQALCEGCHTVGQLGNYMVTDGGWQATKDERYYDVQCESCHGPGLGHVQNPSKGTVGLVLAPMSAGTELTTGCGECHSGSHQPFVAEWAGSAHGTMSRSATPAPRPGCRDCHSGEDALIAWGVNTNYLEKKTVVGDSTKNLPVTCTVCHDPHGNGNDGQLRFAIDVPDEDSNLCMKCHHKRGNPDLASANRNSHSPEGPVLLGYGGWWPPNMAFPEGKVVATHGSEANPRLCAGCHVNKFSGTDAQGNPFVATGHSFEPTPCVDAGGKPTGEHDCTRAQRTYRTCVGAGCHGTENVARSLQLTSENRLALLADELDRTLQKIHANWKTCRSNNSCGTGSPFRSTDNVYTTAEGAAFNYYLALQAGTAVHNPFLAEALLTASIKQVRLDYSIAAASAIDLGLLLSQH